MQKRLFRKFTALAVVLVMLFIFTAACANNDQPASTPAPTPAPAATPAPVQPGGDGEDEPEPDSRFDFGGREFVILNWDGGTATFDPDPAIEDPDADTGDWDNLQRILEEFNGSVRYEVAAHEDIFALFVTGMLAGGTPPWDFVEIPQSSIMAAVFGDFLTPMEDIVPADDPFWGDFGTWWSLPGTMIDGKHWGMTGPPGNKMPWTMSYNKNLMLDAGLDDPGLLYDRGGWTWDVFVDYLRTLTKLGPDGVPTQWGLSGPPDEILKLMLASNNGSIINDAFGFGLDSDNSLAAFDFFDQVIVQESLAKPFTDWWGDFITFGEGDVGFWVNEHWSIWVGGLHFDEDVAVGGVPFPKGPANNRGYTHFENIGLGLSVPKGVPNPLQCYDMWFEMATAWRVMSNEALDSETGVATMEEWWDATDSYILDTIYGDTEADGLRMKNDWNKYGKIDWGRVMGVLGYDDVKRLAIGEVTTSQFIEEVRPEINDKIEEFFGAMRR